MTDERNAYGYFNRGNRLGKGRPPGARNKPKEFAFAREGSDGLLARRFQTVASSIAYDLGGRENLTEAQQQLIRRAAMLSVQCERMEKSVISGEDLNAVAYGQLTGHLVRTLSVLGLKREPIDVTPALHQYLDTLAPAEPQELVAAGDKNED